MAESIRVPGVGAVKRQYVYVAAALIAGIAGYAWWTRGRTPAEPAAVDSAVSEGLFADDTVGAGVSGNVQYAGTPGQGENLIDTNAEWAQHAVDLLEGAGFDRGASASALAEFLGRQELDDREQNIVRTALALAGPPPQGEYQVIPEAGGSKPPAGGLTAPSSLRLVRNYSRSVTIDWNDVTGATKYRITVKNLDRGVTSSATATTSTYTRSQLGRGVKYRFTVAGIDVAGNVGPAANIEVRVN